MPTKKHYLHIIYSKSDKHHFVIYIESTFGVLTSACINFRNSRKLDISRVNKSSYLKSFVCISFLPVTLYKKVWVYLYLQIFALQPFQVYLFPVDTQRRYNVL